MSNRAGSENNQPKIVQRLLLLVFFVWISSILPLMSCARKPSGTKNLKIGVVIYQANDTFIDLLCSSMTASVRQREEAQQKEIILNIVAAKNDQNYQNTLIDRMLRQNFDVLCVNLVDRTMSAPIINKCRAANVPLVFFNREPVEEDIAAWDKIYYVGTSPIDSANLQGEMLLDLLVKDFSAVDQNNDGKIQYAHLEGEPGHQDALYRTEYSVAVLTDAGIIMEKLAGDTANWNLNSAYQITNSWLDQYGTQIEVVLSNDDDMALGAIKAYQVRNVPRRFFPYVFGIDATPVGLAAIKEGTMYGTVVNDYVEQAAVIVDIALALAEEKNPAEHNIPFLIGQTVRIPHRPLTALNCDEEIKKLQEVH